MNVFTCVAGLLYPFCKIVIFSRMLNMDSSNLCSIRFIREPLDIGGKMTKNEINGRAQFVCLTVLNFLLALLLKLIRHFINLAYVMVFYASDFNIKKHKQPSSKTQAASIKTSSRHDQKPEAASKILPRPTSAGSPRPTSAGSSSPRAAITQFFQASIS